MTKKFDYWTKRGVYQIKPSFPFGTSAAIFTLKNHLNDDMLKQDEETKNLPYYGSYFLRAPILMVKDPEILRHIMVKDFDAFVDRNSSNVQNMKKTETLTDKIMTEQMTMAEGDNWKNIR